MTGALLVLKNVHQTASKTREQWVAASIDTPSTIYAELDSKVAARTLTDADGKYSLTLPRIGNYYLIAQAKRDVGKATEIYYWTIPIENKSDASELEIMLANHNLTKDPGEVIDHCAQLVTMKLPKLEKCPDPELVILIEKLRDWRISFY